MSNIRRLPRVVWGLCLALSALMAAAQEPPAETGVKETPKIELFKDGKLDIAAAVKHFEDLYRSRSSTSRAELTVIKPRSERTMRMRIWTKGEDHALIVIEEPKREKDTATLRVDKNLWNYLPRIKRTIRIPPSMMLTSWMGSDFTNDDLVKESSLRRDYTFELLGHPENSENWLIRFKARPDVVGLWDRFELEVSADGLIPISAKYYDRKERLSRTMVWDAIKEFDGRRLPSRMTMVPVDQEGHKTIMQYLEMDFDVDVPDDTFSLTRLEQKR